MKIWYHVIEVIGDGQDLILRLEQTEPAFDEDWESPDCYCDKKAKQPYKKEDFEALVNSKDPGLFNAFKKSHCSSLWNLQKNAWKSKWDNGFIGLVGEVVAMDILSSSVYIGTLTDNEINGTLSQMFNEMLALETAFRYIYAPTNRTDYILLYAANVIPHGTLKLPFCEIKRDRPIERWAKSGQRKPCLIRIREQFQGTGVLCVEVKTVGKPRIFSSMIRGFDQLLQNPFVVSGGVPILQIDYDRFREAFRTMPVSYHSTYDTDINGKSYLLTSKKGGIWLEENLNKKSIERLQSLINAIRLRPDLKPPLSYYNKPGGCSN